MAKRGMADEAVQLLQTLEDDWSSKQSHIRPNLIMYNQVLNAFKHATRAKGTGLYFTKSEELLNKMIDLGSNSKHSRRDVLPDVVTFSTVLETLSYCSDKDINASDRLYQSLVDNATSTAILYQIRRAA